MNKMYDTVLCKPVWCCKIQEGWLGGVLPDLSGTQFFTESEFSSRFIPFTGATWCWYQLETNGLVILMVLILARCLMEGNR